MYTDPQSIAFLAGERSAYMRVTAAVLQTQCNVTGPAAGQRSCQGARALAADLAELAPHAANSEWKYDDSLFPESVLPSFLLPPFRFDQKLMIGMVYGVALL